MKASLGFGVSRQWFLASLCAVILCVVLPVQNAQAEQVSGRINGIDLSTRVIDVEGHTFKLSLQPEIIDMDGESKQKMSIEDLKERYHVEFEPSNGIVYSLRVFKNGLPQ